MFFIKSKTIWLLCLFVLYGCAQNIHGNSEVVFPEKLNNARNFSFFSDKPLLRSIPELPSVAIGPIESKLRETIAGELNELGYQKSEPDKADFFVAYSVSAVKREDSYNTVSGGRLLRGAVISTTTREYVEGALVIDFFDPQSGEQIWHGWIQEKLHSNNSPEERNQKIQDAVSAILSTLTPK